MKRNSEQILTEWLVTNCQLGDGDAMRQLVTIWYPKLLRYAVRQLGDQQKAQDAVQNTFEAVNRTIGKLKDPAAFPKWIYQVLHNKSIDLIRQKLRQEKQSADYQAFQTCVSEGSQSTEPLSESIEFEQMLEGLEADLYRLVHLHYLEGFSMGEISNIVDIPVGTVKSRLHQARNLIRQNLTGESNG